MKKYYEAIMNFAENRNLVPKIASILLAVILWAYISSTKSGDVRFRLPVTYTGLEENFAVSMISHKNALVEVNGNKDDLKNISSRNIRLFVDLSKVESGDYRIYPLQYQKIDIADEFRINISPEEVRILVEKKITRNIRIIPRYTGIPGKGYMAGKIKINPEYVKVSGPASKVDNVGALYTDEISVKDKTAAFQQDIKISRVNEEQLEYSLAKVSATVPIIDYSEVTTIEIPLVIKNQKKGYSYLANYNKIKINVILPENKSITEHTFTAYIDADEIETDNYRFSKKSRIEVMRYVHIAGDSSETGNAVLSAAPDIVEIVVAKD